MEKLLVFHLSEQELYKLKKITGVQKIRTVLIADTDYRQTLDTLVSGQKNPMILPYTDFVPDESMIVLCDFTEQRMDKLLLSIRKSRIKIDYKAVLTPTNRTWNVLRLFLEMQTEKKAFEQNKKSGAS